MQVYEINELGRFEFREPAADMSGVVIAAPHGGTEPETAVLAKRISERIGAGLVLAYGFKSQRISVAQPLARARARATVRRSSAEKRSSVFPELKQLLRDLTDGEVDLYVELRTGAVSEGVGDIQVASSGFSFEETKEISRLYGRACERLGGGKQFQRPSLSLDTDEGMGGDTWGIRHHGAMMIAEKALRVQIPKQFLAGEDSTAYGAILSAWVNDIAFLVSENARRVPGTEVQLLEFGRFDALPSKKALSGMVIGAPHGSYDAFTAEVAAALAVRSGLAAVIARGFTPTETGDGMRINVNRPTERHVSASEREFETHRSRAVYEQFRRTVLRAAGGRLDLYIDIHQNSGSRIEVATVGLSKREAQLIKDAYHTARSQALAAEPNGSSVDLAIEPLDDLEVGAWAAKSNGILSLARRSLHFELPADGVMGSMRQRRIYTAVLGRLIANLPSAFRAASQN
jgi:hypothetical protein